MSEFECKTESAKPTWALIIPVIVFGILLIASWVWGAREVKEEVNKKAKAKAKTNNNSPPKDSHSTVASTESIEVKVQSADEAQAGAESNESDQSPWDNLPFKEKAKRMKENMWEHEDIYMSPALKFDFDSFPDLIIKIMRQNVLHTLS